MDGDKSELPDRIDVGVAARQVWNLYQQANGATFNLYSGSLAGKTFSPFPSIATEHEMLMRRIFRQI